PQPVSLTIYLSASAFSPPLSMYLLTLSPSLLPTTQPLCPMYRTKVGSFVKLVGWQNSLFTAPAMALLTFGVITDIQYADKEDGYDYLQLHRRYYRNSLHQTAVAIDHWTQPQPECSTNTGLTTTTTTTTTTTNATTTVSFVLNLGDLLDGYNRRNGVRDEALARISEVLARFPGNIYHAWGNHELYNFSQEELLRSSLNSATLEGCCSGCGGAGDSVGGGGGGEGSVGDGGEGSVGDGGGGEGSVGDGGGGEGSVGDGGSGEGSVGDGGGGEGSVGDCGSGEGSVGDGGGGEGSVGDDGSGDGGNKKVPENSGYYSFTPHRSLKIVVLNCYNLNVIDKCGPNYGPALQIFCAKNSNKDINSSEGLDESSDMFVAYNGAVGRVQLQWLAQCLQQAEQLQQNVIVCGHCPIYKESASSNNICWDSCDVRRLISRFPCVIAYFAGHEHRGGAAIDNTFTTANTAIHHITFAGVLETSPDRTCFATVQLHSDSLLVLGHGIIPNYSVPLYYKIKAS
ncbi:hypothetical protein Ahia01_001055900, partial [Argonauta hians]